MTATATSPADRGEQIIANLRLVEARSTRRETWDAWWEVLDGEVSRLMNDPEEVRSAINAYHGGLLRIAGAVLVASKELVAEVFLNAQGRYTVSGYADRMRASFGRIYLGRDEGSRYDRESRLSNEAIMGIKREDAFALAFERTNALLCAKPELKDQFPGLVSLVLAQICTQWFDLPDERHVMTGFTAVDTSFEPARCPGHYDFPSNHVFRPHPTPASRCFGVEQSVVVREATDAYVRSVRAGSGTPKGQVTRALFDTFSDTPRDNELLSRSLVGVMLGFLPTTKFNLIFAMRGWTTVAQDTTRPFDDIIKRYTEAKGTPFEKADTIEVALGRAMQERPQPGAVWRTVAKGHKLGHGESAVRLRAGDMVVVWIEGAMRDLASVNDPSVFPVFGGDRRADPAPRHACPGYEAAMGTMLGILAAHFELRVCPVVPPVRHTP